MNSFISNIISTIIGVLVGGLITMKINELTNTKLLKKEHTLKILQEIKYLLNNWYMQIFRESLDPLVGVEKIEELNFYCFSTDLHKLRRYFNTNMSILKKFQKNFLELETKNEKLIFSGVEYQHKLIETAKKNNLSTHRDIFIHSETSKILKDHRNEAEELMQDIQGLVALIDAHIGDEILNSP